MKSIVDTMELLILMVGVEFYLNYEKSEALLLVYSEILAMFTGIF